MNYKIKPNFFSIVVFFIVGGALVNQFDFETLKLQKPALAIVYTLVLIISFGFMIKKSKK